MPQTTPHHLIPRYTLLFPDWTGARPLTFFMLENLLEARAQSSFPTGSRCADEDVNVYLAHLLTEHFHEPVPSGVEGGSAPLVLPLPKETTTRRENVEHYRRNGDHRLLCLGLYGRGDICRRRHPPWGWSREGIRKRDLADGRSCYTTAANLLRGTKSSRSALVPVLCKLAGHFEGYVHVLEVLARFRFDLGARLSDEELHKNSIQNPQNGETTIGQESTEMDDLLDLLSAYQRQPTAELAQRLRQAASRQGIDPDLLLNSEEE